MNRNDLPLGLGMALSKNEPAMKQFEALSEQQKSAVINRTKKINSKYEMQCLVNGLSEGTLNL